MVTVILCSYNGEKYITSQIDSILGQASSGVRLCVFDDASTDHTPDILADYANKYPDIFSYKIRSSGTGSSCINFLTALHEVADTDYYMLSDQDDIWHTDKLTAMLSAIRSRENENSVNTPIIVHSNAVVVDEECNLIHPDFMKYEKISPERVAFNQLLLQNCVTGGAMIFNTALKQLISDMPVPRHAAIHDHWIAIAAAAFGRIYYIDEKLYDYRQHTGNQIGAYKASFIGETMRRLGLGNESKAEIDAITRMEFERLFTQAEEFKRIYGAQLDAGQLEICDAFISIRNGSRLSKISTIFKYGFFFNNYYRAIGELFFI